VVAAAATTDSSFLSEPVSAAEGHAFIVRDSAAEGNFFFARASEFISAAEGHAFFVRACFSRTRKFLLCARKDTPPLRSHKRRRSLVAAAAGSFARTSSNQEGPSA
jgi:hypothetical protein